MKYRSDCDKGTAGPAIGLCINYRLSNQYYCFRLISSRADVDEKSIATNLNIIICSSGHIIRNPSTKRLLVMAYFCCMKYNRLNNI